MMVNLEPGWVHDVAFSPSGENLAWVSHNSIIFAVSSNNPSRLVGILSERFLRSVFRITMEITNYLPFRCIIFVSESTLIAGVSREEDVFENERNFILRVMNFRH